MKILALSVTLAGTTIAVIALCLACGSSGGGGGTNAGGSAGTASGGSSGSAGSGAGGSAGSTTTPCGPNTCSPSEACVQQGCGGFIPDGGTCTVPPPQCTPLPSQCKTNLTCACLSTMASCGTVYYGKLTCSNLCG